MSDQERKALMSVFKYRPLTPDEWRKQAVKIFRKQQPTNNNQESKTR
jgi:hypothetical protein